MGSYLNEFRGGTWIADPRPGGVDEAFNMMRHLDALGSKIPRRIVVDGHVIASGRWCSRDTPVNDIRAFWIVMSLDKIGPCERDGQSYFQHPSRDAALAEARRLSQACRGGRFGILELVHVTGWVDTSLGTPF